ncbi:hypothetical protein [Nocardia sp. NPDC049149]|uniref:hypothetical protein n=1 Tax=Nocardia sp. NPDC049149 TaxID=3364315 RepID=UPI00372189FB
MPSTVDVEVVVDDFGGAHDVQERSAWILDVRRQIELLETEVQEATKVLALELSNDGVPMRDIATLVGTTFQRVGQLVAEHDSKDLDTIRQDAIRQIQRTIADLHDRGKSAPLWDLAFPAPIAVALPKRATTDEMLNRVADSMILAYGSGKSRTMVHQLAARLMNADAADRGEAVDSVDAAVRRDKPQE